MELVIPNQSDKASCVLCASVFLKGASTVQGFLLMCKLTVFFMESEYYKNSLLLKRVHTAMSNCAKYFFSDLKTALCLSLQS